MGLKTDYKDMFNTVKTFRQEHAAGQDPYYKQDILLTMLIMIHQELKKLNEKFP